VIRILDREEGFIPLADLGIPKDLLEVVREALAQPHGLILISGPTGSGKSTTLYSMLSELNRDEKNVLSLEDPIEYNMEGVTQSQVRPEIGYTFATGLRTTLRQDPDIIMVGEIRDKETASLAINAALTGHLVLSTLHTNSAAGAIPRLLDMGIEPFLLVSTLRVIIGQRLVRQLCENREKRELTRPEIARLEENFDLGRVLNALKEEKIVSKETTWKGVPFFSAKEDAQCPEGYSGRMGIYEVLPVTETIKAMVIAGATSDDIDTQAKKDGMLSMGEDGIFKCAQGVSTIEEVLRVISE
jgi:type IV pilus assembly protein PilB